MQKITTFLLFKEKAAEAMEFYVSLFENSRIVNTMPGPGGRAMGGTFEIDGQRFNAFDGGPHFSFSPGISLFVSCRTQQEIDHLYERLSDGGEKQPCGWVTDRFGVSWQIVPPILGELLGHPDRDKANAVMQAMMKMHKLDIKGLEDAAASAGK